MNEVYPSQNKEVPDPFYGAEDGYHRVYEMIEIACDAIIKNHANWSIEYISFFRIGYYYIIIKKQSWPNQVFPKELGIFQQR